MDGPLWLNQRSVNNNLDNIKIDARMDKIDARMDKIDNIKIDKIDKIDHIKIDKIDKIDHIRIDVQMDAKAEIHDLIHDLNHAKVVIDDQMVAKKEIDVNQINIKIDVNQINLKIDNKDRRKILINNPIMLRPILLIF
jgi:hypothetical protein